MLLEIQVGVRWGSLVECRGLGSQGGEGERDPLADVLPGEDDAAGLAFEAADVPLFVQRQERLAMLDLFLAPSTVCEDKRTPLNKGCWAS